MGETNFANELEALQRWCTTAASLASFHAGQAPTELVRPVVEFKPPYRERDRNRDRYVYVNKVIQYGVLYVATLAQGMSLQDKLFSSLEEAMGRIPVYGLVDDGRGGQQEGIIAWLFDARLEFQTAAGLDIPFTLTYYVSYTRTRPINPPPASFVGTRVKGQIDNRNYNFANYPKE